MPLRQAIMNTSNHRLEKAHLDAQWDKLVAASPNATIFSHRAYLEALEGRFGLYYLYKKQEIRGGLVVAESANGESAVLHPFMIYGGVLFPNIAHKQNRAQVNSERFELCEAVAQGLPTLYREVELALSPGVTDIRAFLWHNYGEEGRHYQPDVRYTAEVPIAELATTPRDASELFAQCSSARRQEVRYAEKKGVHTEEAFLPEQFTQYYAKTMGRQGIEVPAAECAAMERLITALGAAGLARMFVSRTAQGEIGSMAVMALDQHRAYYLFGASDPALRESHCGSAVLWEAFTALARDGVQEVDLEGVNSPKRGWFKLSFGASMRVYYELGLK